MRVPALYVLLLPLASAQAVAQTDPHVASPQSSILSRRYREGEFLAYHMKATNQGQNGTIRYEADARGVVKKTAAGFLEEYEWANLIFNGQAMTLPASNFRQTLSLDSSVPPSLPDFSRINPMLIGPAADMVTFYADEWLAVRQAALEKSSDHVYVKNGAPSSWADGVHTIVGQDSIDFDLTLRGVDAQTKTAKVLVRHVPPAQPEIKTPAKWMLTPVADTANNWVEVSKTSDGKCLAEIGKETFDVELTISLVDGKILSATMDNPVKVLARKCADAELAQCAAPKHYEIRRRVEISRIP